jgi:hypothetical protein
LAVSHWRSYIFFWNKNLQKQETVIPTPGEAGRNENHANLVIPTRKNRIKEKISSNLSPINKKIHKKENKSNHEPVVIEVINDGQETIPITTNGGKLPTQNIDSDVLQQLKNEMLQTLRQEFMQNLEQQNNGQSSSSRNNGKEE